MRCHSLNEVTSYAKGDGTSFDILCYVFGDYFSTLKRDALELVFER